jgi:hypothetical protein
MAYFAEGPSPNGVFGLSDYTTGGMAEAPATPQADSIQRIVGRAMALVVVSERYGERLSAEQKRRISCWLPKLIMPGGDDRFITAQSILDFRNMTWRPAPSYSSAKQWLLPEYAIRRGIIAPDATIVRTLRQIDEMIIDGRHKINQEYAIQGGAVHVRVRQIRDWVAAREADPKSIYSCYRG